MEKVLPGMATFAQTKYESSHLSQVQGPKGVKRKFEGESPGLPYGNIPDQKRRKETVNFVQIPVPSDQKLDLTLQDQGRNEAKVSNVAEVEMIQNSNVTMQTFTQHSTQTHDQPTDHATKSRSNIEKPVSGTSHAMPAALSNTDLRETIEAQFSLEILLKHKELRLIDQEFAKCQAALEQLRRCRVVPYPAVSSDSEIMQEVSSGSGPVFNDQAPFAAPWGTTNGPYTRHYQRWLIPDPAFGDHTVGNAPQDRHNGEALSARAMRGSKAENGVLTGPSRSQRGSSSGLAALPHGYPEQKEQKGPAVAERKSDGKMVKLVCLDCRRSNFNSTQGFVNHCRIAHSRHFVDHQKAIEACGEEIDGEDEEEMAEGRNHSSQAIASAGLVHPLIRSSGQVARTKPNEQSTSEGSVSSESKRQPTSLATGKSTSPSLKLRGGMFSSQQLTPAIPSISAPSLPTVPFTPSPQAPHLSALFAKMGRGGDLDDMVTEAQTMPDLDLLFPSDEEDEESEEVPAEPEDEPQSRSTRAVLRGGHYPVHRGKSPLPSRHSPVGSSTPQIPEMPNYPFNIDIPQPYHSQYPRQAGHDYQDTPTLEHNSPPFDLSPNTTEAHTAPSLVSDDGDYENTHSESESPGSAEADEEEDHYVHTEVLDHDDMELAAGSSAHHHIGLGGKPHAPTPSGRPRQLSTPMNLHNGETERRHVSFASPVRRRRDSKVQNEK